MHCERLCIFIPCNLQKKNSITGYIHYLNQMSLEGGVQGFFGLKTPVNASEKKRNTGEC